MAKSNNQQGDRKMTVRKSMLGLTVVCALLFSAFTAANASAAEGTTFRF
jgi:hypothetical protein